MRVHENHPGVGGPQRSRHTVRLPPAAQPVLTGHASVQRLVATDVQRLQASAGNRAVQDLMVQRRSTTTMQRFVPTGPMVLSPAMLRLLRYLGSEAQRAYQYFSTQKYGCYCGKGSECPDGTPPRDNLDRCCLLHDSGYGRHGVNTTIDMWTPLGFRLSRQADLDLVSCAQRTIFELHWYGPAAAAYRSALILLFTLRADIARRLESLPNCIKNNGTTPLYDVDALLTACTAP